MRTLVAGLAVIGVWIGTAAPARGQQSTEMFIPIGQSPGLSGTATVIGELESIDAEKRTLTVIGPDGARAVVTTERTRIWVDRTRVGLPNHVGTLSDLQPGRRVEIKFQKAGEERVAEWIKVEDSRPTGSTRAVRP